MTTTAIKTIKDKGKTLQLEISADKVYDISKGDVKLKLSGGKIFIYDNSDSLEAGSISEKQAYVITPADVTGVIT